MWDLPSQRAKRIHSDRSARHKVFFLMNMQRNLQVLFLRTIRPGIGAPLLRLIYIAIIWGGHIYVSIVQEQCRNTRRKRFIHMHPVFPNFCLKNRQSKIGRNCILRSKMLYDNQEKRESIEVHTDTDCAGCVRTRKSTSGGVLKMRKPLDQVMEFNSKCHSIILW